ncbi:MAG TPA: hypothetical protein VGP92_12430 [Acidimicrobiia bacterium]|nr:hypothetical protein [Acidimicrobiia bacterium]
MKRLLCILGLVFFGSMASAHGQPPSGSGSTDGGGEITVGVTVGTPGSGTSGGDSNRPLVRYTISWSVDPTPAQTGSLNGLCLVAGSTAQQPVFGFLYHLIGTDPSGAIVDDRFQCVAFVNGDPTQRPPEPPLPAVPTFAEAWNSVQLPAPTVTLDPARRGITGLDTRISTTGATTIVIAATIRGYTITGTATLDHYAISVDGQAATDAGTGHYTFETKGNHTIAVSAFWHGVAAITGPGLPNGLPTIDLGSATITSTRVYPVNEIRSVLQP